MPSEHWDVQKQLKQFDTPRRVKGTHSEVLLKALDGKLLPALQRDVFSMCQCRDGDGKVLKLCLSC